MHTIAIDIETYSSVDLLKSGVYKYTEAPDFTILLIAVSVDGGPVDVFDLSFIPDAKRRAESKIIIDALVDPKVKKTAFNAAFERTCLQAFYRKVKPDFELDPAQWECTAVKAAMLGLPLSLDAVSKALELEETKSADGKALIRYFSVPCKPTKTNGGRTRNLPEHDPEKWEKFKAYCAQDVRVEQTIREKIAWFEIPETEVKLYNLDQRINDAGILIDRKLVKHAITLDLENKDQLTKKAIELTGLVNPNSVTQLKNWLGEETGEEINSLNKKEIPTLLKLTDSDAAKQVLRIRQELGKTSVKKYLAMAHAVCADGRVRGLLQFYGANRTGRWAGRLVQVQNLPRNYMHDLDLARECAKDGDLEQMQMLFDNVPDTLSQLIRTAFVAPPGKTFVVADFSAIEARVIAWLAGETWRLEVFKTHGKIYEASAAAMFKVPIESIGKGSDLRQKGKVAELALGYQGGPAALIAMGALEMGIPEEELPRLVKMWRNANKKIVQLWYDVQEIAINAVKGEEHTDIRRGPTHGTYINFRMSGDVLLCDLPAYRTLAYQRPRIKEGKFGDQLTYSGIDQVKKIWVSEDTYGGKLVENIVQAVSRDCLADAMLRLDAAGYRIVMHVHDEVVIEVPEEDAGTALEAVNKIMSSPVSWAPGLPLNADGYITKYYCKKD